jgi:hypothetical protein
MRSITVAPLAAAAFAMAGACPESALADPDVRISGPHVHANLAIYLVHGASLPGPVPLTLQEAIANGHVLVSETGRVNELEIENKGSEPVFIQAGDMVKGGRQDRVLTVSFLLPANSGRLPIASYCVEQGRWSARGTEDLKRFSSAGEAMPSRSALLAMAAPPPPKEPSQPQAGAPAGSSAAPAVRGVREVDEVAAKQRQVWDSVAATQMKLSRGLNAPVASPQSASSLQLALENAKLKEARAAYMAALQPVGETEGDTIGYILAINGRMSSANLYPSNALFRKMWDKQLAAAVTEAIGEAAGATGGSAPTAPAAPAVAAARAFLEEAKTGSASERPVATGTLAVHDAEKLLYNEARAADGQWIHRSYLAK